MTSSPPYLQQWPLPEWLQQKLWGYAGSWRGERAHPDSLIVGANVSGMRPPLFWIFQGEREWAQLAKYLGPEQPVYGMRSGHLVVDYREDNIQHLALAYLEEIETLCPEGPLALGGNCQAGLIAEAIAQHWLRRKRRLDLLVLMEWSFPFKAYSGPVVLVFGENSHVANPYLRFRYPERAWQQALSDYRVAFIPGAHGHFFDEPNVQALAATLTEQLEAAHQAPKRPLGAEDFAVELSVLEPPTQILAGLPTRLTVRVRNASTTHWPDGAAIGLMLGNRWLNANGEVVIAQDGRVPLPALEPEAQATLVLPVQAPPTPGPATLRLALIEEGVRWHEGQDPNNALSLTVIEPINKPSPALPSRAAQRIAPVIIGGTGGSGTRVVARILHSAGVFLGERCNGSDDSLDMAGAWFQSLLPYWNQAVPEPLEADIRAAFNKTLETFLQPLEETDLTRLWGWALPPTAFFMPFFWHIWPEARCIHLVRDGRDMAFSANQNQLGYLGPFTLEGEEGLLEPAARSLKLWERLNGTLADVGERRPPGTYLQLRYEDLCEQPQETIARLLAFLDLPGDPGDLVSLVKPSPQRGRWRAQSPVLIDALHRQADAGLARFGYASTRRQTLKPAPQFTPKPDTPEFTLAEPARIEHWAPTLINHRNEPVPHGEQRILRFQGKHWFLKIKRDCNARFRDVLAWRLGQGWANIPEVALLTADDMPALQASGAWLPDWATHEHVWLVRMAQDHPPEELTHRNLDSAVASELVFSLWACRGYARMGNRRYVHGIPMFFGHQIAFLGEPTRADFEAASGWRLAVTDSSDSAALEQRVRQADSHQSIALHLIHDRSAFQREAERHLHDLARQNAAQWFATARDSGFDLAEAKAIVTGLIHQQATIRREWQRLLRIPADIER